MLIRLPSGVMRAGLVHGAKLGEQRAGRGKRAFGRRIGKGELAGRRAPGRAIQHQAGKFGLQNFRPVIRAQAPLGRLGPKPDGKAGRFTPRAAGALVGRRAADTLCRQPGQAARRIETRRCAENRHR